MELPKHAPELFRHAANMLEKARWPEETAMPDWIRERLNGYRDNLLAQARSSWEESGQWFFSRGAARDNDEQETVAVWVDVLQFVSLQELPGYSEENRQSAIAFWKSWQNRETGVMYNPRYQNPQKPEEMYLKPEDEKLYYRQKYHNGMPNAVNDKYIVVILRALGSEPDIPVSSTGMIAYENLWAHIERSESSPAGGLPVNMLYGEGWEEKLPAIEAGFGAILRGYDRENGLWRIAPPARFDQYTPSAGFKIIARLSGYCGLVNYPQEVIKNGIDALIAHREELNGTPDLARNWGEMTVHYLTITDYRREELFAILQKCLEGFRDPAWWESTKTASYCIFGSGMIGGILHWKELSYEKIPQMELRFKQGGDLNVRLEGDPYGNWVNIFPKPPEEAGKTMKELTAEAWKRKIETIRQPVRFHPDNGTPMEFSFASEGLSRPYLSASWAGKYEVFVNGHLVKRLEYDLPEHKAGLYIPTEYLSENNVVGVRYGGKGKQPLPGEPETAARPFMEIGVIDWR